MRKIEPSVNDHLKFSKFVKEIQQLDRDSLMEITVELARLALLMQPAAIRWAAYEAAENLGGAYGSTRHT